MPASGQSPAPSAADYAAQRKAMVAKEIEAAGVRNPRVLDAMRRASVPYLVHVSSSVVAASADE